MCKHNRSVAQKYGSQDIVMCWTLAHMMALSIESTRSARGDYSIFQHMPFPQVILKSL